MTATALGNSRGTLRSMKVAVRLFAGLRELAGTRSVELDLPEGALAADVWPALSLGDEPPGLLVAVNKRYAAGTTVLGEGDEVALIPPVSGGAFTLSELPLTLDGAVREVASDDAGAIATFTGTTRARSRGREVVRLEYEAYEGMAEAEMERIAADLKERHSLIEVAIHHRVGVVGIGETSVVIAVSSAHRAAALAACAEAIDTLKGSVPLWKKEIYVGGEEWIGQGS
jgi:molybdopterin synthase catalytic subunit/molybdopterin converting factor small subunit